MDYFCGVDIGSTYIKTVTIDGNCNIKGSHISPSGVDFKTNARLCFEKTLLKSGLAKEDIKYIVSTGFGRYSIDFANVAKTEILAHAKGAYFYFPKEITVIDIGGRDSKIIKISSEGNLKNFKMNRSCAAGTGIFLEFIAKRLDIPLERLHSYAEKAESESTISSYCTVFASIEVLDKLAVGEKIENIVLGVYKSLVRRISESDSMEGEVILTGGVVAYNEIISVLLREYLNKSVYIPKEPQLTGAFGAAIVGKEIYTQIGSGVGDCGG